MFVFVFTEYKTSTWCCYNLSERLISLHFSLTNENKYKNQAIISVTRTVSVSVCNAVFCCHGFYNASALQLLPNNSKENKNLKTIVNRVEKPTKTIKLREKQKISEDEIKTSKKNVYVEQK